MQQLQPGSPKAKLAFYLVPTVFFYLLPIFYADFTSKFAFLISLEKLEDLVTWGWQGLTTCRGLTSLTPEKGRMPEGPPPALLQHLPPHSCVILPLEVGHERGEESCIGGILGFGVTSGSVVGRGGQQSFRRIPTRQMSAEPRCVWALSWVIFTENHICFSQSNTKVGLTVISFST